MARKLRLEFPGACYHVLNRGNHRRNLFARADAAAAFERVLFQAAARFGWRLHAFVIMRNHFHLAVETPEPNLSVGMKWLQGTWAARFNRYRGEAGRLFQGRYKAQHVEAGHVLAQVAHYVHLNPVRAKAVPADQLLDFRWSSLHHFCSQGRPGCLVPDTILAESGGLTDSELGWREYVAYLALLAEESPELRQQRFEDISRGWCVGTTEFREELKRRWQEGGEELEGTTLLGADKVSWREEMALAWEKKLQDAARVAEIDLVALPVRRSAPEKVRLAAVMKATTSVSNGWLAQRLGMGQPASVSQ